MQGLSIWMQRLSIWGLKILAILFFLAGNFWIVVGLSSSDTAFQEISAWTMAGAMFMAAGVLLLAVLVARFEGVGRSKKLSRSTESQEK